MSNDELVVESVIVRFGEKQVLSDVYLRCITGTVIGILGRNGCGKSSLLKVIFGTLSTENKSIRINNKIYAKPYLTKNLIAFLPQESFLPRNLSLREIIYLFVEDNDIRNSIIQDQAVHPNLRKTARQLSGGELRYFEILLVLSSKAKFVLLDEPFMGIEPLYQEKVKNLIRQNKTKKGFIFTDHNYREIIEISDILISISEGRCKRISNVEQLEEMNYLPTGTLSGDRKITTGIAKSLYAAKSKQFEIDSQTYKDLGLFYDNRNGSFLSLFSSATTTGGNEMLITLLKSPVNDPDILETRRDCFMFFSKNNIELKHSQQQMEMIEYYLASQAPLLTNGIWETINSYARNTSIRKNDKYIITTGITKILLLLKHLDDVCNAIGTKGAPDYLLQSILTIRNFIARPEISHRILPDRQPGPDIYRLDRFFRRDGKQYLNNILKILYEFEVFETVAKTVERHKLNFPRYTHSQTSGIIIKGLFHPLIRNAVRNDFQLGKNQNLCVLTGANMSGKSTFLKSFGLAVYLSHAGFPVPAEDMETSIFNGLVSTINLSDNIEKGYSHFYSEVRRVKHTARQIKDRKRIVVICDELFRGTNVKEAYDASLLITSAFAKIKSSLFLISTHIVEIGEELKKYENIVFKCFQSKLNGEIPIYNHEIKDGISADRMGLNILKNENVIEILEEAAEGEEGGIQNTEYRIQN